MRICSLAALLVLLSLSACSIILPVRSSGVQPAPVIDTSPALQPLAIDDVQVEIGVGSPIPVQVVVGGNLPDTCAQVASATQQQDGMTLRFTLSTIPSSAAGCTQDTLPFRMSIPLNIVGLQPGEYVIEVNGVTTTLAIPVQ